MQYCCLRLTNRSEGSWKHSSRTAKPTFTVCQGPREVVQPTLFLSLCLMIISKARGAAYYWSFIIITLSLLASCDLLLEIQYGKTVLPTEQGYLLCAREREGYLLCARERESPWRRSIQPKKTLNKECCQTKVVAPRVPRCIQATFHESAAPSIPCSELNKQFWANASFSTYSIAVSEKSKLLSVLYRGLKKSGTCRP